MARAREHDEDAVLDAARAVVLGHGVRATTIAAISAASGAPSGSLYHAFGSRHGVLAAVWRRATRRGQQRWLAAGEEHPEDPVEAGVAMALAGLGFARESPEDVRVPTVLRPADFANVTIDLEVHNKPIRDGVRTLAARIGGPDAAMRVHLATLELPYGALQMRLEAGAGLPASLDRHIAAAARVVLEGR